MSQAPEQQAYKLVKQLYARTLAGKVRWEPEGSVKVRTTFDPYSLVMYSVKDPEFPDSPDYFIEVVDDMDRTVETISNYTLQPFMEEKFDDLNPYQLFSRLFLTARRNALGADRALGAILQQLGDS
jgi:hypothetical protein